MFRVIGTTFARTNRPVRCGADRPERRNGAYDYGEPTENVAMSGLHGGAVHGDLLAVSDTCFNDFRYATKSRTSAVVTTTP